MRIALCEAGIVQPMRDAGSRAVSDLRDGLFGLGHEVRLFTEVEGGLEGRVTLFEPDVIVISRPGLFVRLSPRLRPLGRPIVYLAHDLHFVRLGLQAETEELDPRTSTVMRFVEKVCFESADLALVPTAEEVERVAEEFPSAVCRSIDYFAMPVQRIPSVPPSRSAMVFVGGAFHAPNRQGVGWFLDEVWPRHLERHPDSELAICGEWERSDAAAVPRGVTFTGPLSDEQLDELMASARIGIAPLLFGAGMKRKTLHYLSHGLPVVGTAFAVEGLRKPDGTVPGVVEANSAAEWVESLDLLQDDRLWAAASQAGAAFVQERFSESRYREQLKGVLALLG